MTNNIKKVKTFEAGEITSVSVTDENGEVRSNGTFILTDTSYGKGKIKTLLVCGLGTPVQHRRQGYIRSMIEEMQTEAAAKGAAVALLHPFSFTYYGKFGYERVSDHMIIEFPTADMDFVSRRCNFVPYDETKLSDMISVYSEFRRGRNLLLPRYDGNRYTGGGKEAYIYYENGKPAAYIVVSGEKTLYVNNYVNTVLNIHEMAYVSPSALSGIFSFLRMYEGEYDRIRIYDGSLCPEFDLMLRHYTRAEYKIIPDIAARVLNTEKMLSSADYPEKEGSFTLRVTDGLDTVNGVYRVQFGGGQSSVEKLEDGAEVQITLTAAAFTKIVYGKVPDTKTAAYIQGVEIHDPKTDLFRAFPPRPCGAFEHF